MYRFFLSFLMFTAIITANESEQITVRLSTDTQRIPVYVTRIVNSSNFDSSYIKRLEDVLTFDFNHNGMTYTIDQNAENERLAAQLIKNGATPKEWTSKLYYIIQVTVQQDKKLVVALFSLTGDAKEGVNSLSLTGDISKDRKQIHQLSDAIYKTLFDTNGIATTHLLFSKKPRAQSSENWVAEIWECDYDGQNARPVVRDGSYNITPVYIPPKPGFVSGSFLYVSYKSAQPKIFVASLKDGASQRLTLLRGNQLTPAISRQRDLIAFIGDVTGNPDLFLQDFSDTGAVGKPRQIFAAKNATQGSPTISPDGKKIAFVSNKDGTPKVYLIDLPAVGTSLKDTKARLIARHSQECTAPAWSPDGTKLAYCAKVNGIRQIWVYDFNTREERQLTKGPGNKENPSWAPNSLMLTYNCSDTGACELYLVSINQPEPTKLALGDGEKRFPNWEPAR